MPNSLILRRLAGLVLAMLVLVQVATMAASAPANAPGEPQILPILPNPIPMVLKDGRIARVGIFSAGISAWFA